MPHASHPTPKAGSRIATQEAGPMVLVVEDDAILRNVLTDAIRDEGYQAEAVTNGLEALEKLRWGLRPCMVLLDLRMRIMTGWDFRAEQMKEPSLASIPVVAMTSGEWKDRDLTDFVARVQKPIRLDQLQDLLRRHCPPPWPSSGSHYGR